MIQLQVLNKVLQDKDSTMITLNNLTVDYFSEYKSEFYFIKEHLDKYGNIPDMETFLSKFNDFEVIEVRETPNYLLDELVVDKNRRALTEKYNELRPLLMSGDKDAMEKAMLIVKQAAEASANSVYLNATDIIHDTSRYDSYEDMLNNIDKYFIKTGFRELDDIIGGWNAKEDLVTIVARNGLGKSWVLFRCAAAAANQGKRVGLYSGEMGVDNVGYRIDTLIGGMTGQGISNGALVHGNASIRNEYKSFLSSLSDRISGNLWVLTPKDIGGPATVSTLRAFMQKYDLDILFIDQNSLLADDRKAKNPIEKAANISTDLKILQATMQRSIVCVNQQNREKIEDKNGNKSFDTTQVAGTDKVAQDSSIIIFIEREGDLMRLHLQKSRNSGSGQVITYKIDLNTGVFQYIPSSDGNQSEDTSSTGYSEDEVF